MAEVTGSLPFLVDADSGKNDVCCWNESSFFTQLLFDAPKKGVGFDEGKNHSSWENLLIRSLSPCTVTWAEGVVDDSYCSPTPQGMQHVVF